MRNTPAILKVLLFVICLLSSHWLKAQVQVSLSVAPPYPVHLEDLLQYDGQVVITLVNQANKPLQIKLLSTIEGDNGVTVKTKPDFQPSTPFLLTIGQTAVLTGAQLRNLNKNLTENDLDITGVSANQIIQTEQLPEGMYTICVQAFDYATGAPLSSPMSGCAPLNITYYDPPFLTSPPDQEACAPKNPQFQMFTWTPSGIPGKTRYRFELVDLTLNNLSNPNDAFQTPAVQPVFKQENLFTVSLAYDLSKPALVKKHRYAWRVTAYDPSHSISFKNGGSSEVWSFVYKNELDGPNDLADNPNDPDPNPDNNPGDFQQPPTQVFNYGDPCAPKECAPPLPAGPAVTTGFQPGAKVAVGNFELELVTMQWAGSKISGTGRVYVPMFRGRIAVNIQNLELNAQGKALNGKLTALYDLGSNVAEALKSQGNSMEGVTPEMIKQVHTQVENAKKYVKDSLGTDAKLPFAMVTEKLQQLQMIHITAIEFTPAGARFNAFMKVDIPENNSTLGFGAKNICFHPNGLSEQTIDELHMVGDKLELPFGDKITMALYGTGTQGGTYIKWDCSGYQEMQLEGEFRFESSMLVPMNPNTEKLKATFAFNAAVWTDILGKVTFDSFYVAGFKKLGFRAVDVTVDFSDFKNPNGMKFPEGYVGTKDNTWHGFYLKKLNLNLPNYLKKNKKDIVFDMSDAIINKQGFTGKVSLTNILDINNGSVGNWKFSIDKLAVAFVSNSLTNSSFDGKIRVPIAETGIGYHCALSGIGGELKTVFGVSNLDQIDAKFWVAQMQLKPGSSISVEVAGNKVVCKTDFSGTMDVQGEFKDIETLDLTLPGVKFEHLVVSNGPPYLGCQSFGLASPQKKLNGFDISFNPNEAPAEFKDMVGVSLNTKDDTCNLNFGFMITLHEGANGIAGFSNLTIHSKLYQENGMQWAYEKTRLNSIAVDATMSVVRIKGKVEFFYGDDPKFGKGFRGRFEVTFKPTFTANATVQFGKVGGANGFKYWYVDANVKFNQGIAMGPAFALYGFGGGAYYHMSPDTATLPDPAVFKQKGSPSVPAFNVQAMGASDSGTKYMPDKNTLFGFKASVVLGTFPSPRPFNADVYLEANFNGNGGLNMIQLGVDAYFMCDVIDRKDPKVYGKGLIEYKQQGGQRIFNATFGLMVMVKAKGKPVLEGGGQMSIHCESAGPEGEEGKWWVMMGEPSKRCSIAIAGSLKFGAYLMIGNQIPGPPPLPDSLLAHLPYFKHTRVANDDVSGFGFGMDFTMEKDLKFLIFYANLSLVLGFDVFLMDASTMTCPDYPKPGVNNFYATGQMYAGFDAAVGLDINVWFLKARFEVFHAYLYAALAAGLPNPTWVIGEVAGGFEIFNGLAKGEFHLHFKVGDICDEGANDPFGGLKIIADISPKTKNASVFSVPEIAFNADLKKVVTVKTYSESGEKTFSYRFFVEDVVVKRIAEKKNGKMVALANPEIYPGKFDLIKPRLGQFSASSEALKGNSEYEVTVRVYGEREEKGKWVTILDKDSNKKYLEVKKQTFTTDPTPNKFMDENISYTYPHRMQRYFYAQDVKKGVIKFDLPIDLLDKQPPNQAYMYKFVAKFTRIKDGLQVVAETPLHYDEVNWQINFDIPDLMQEQVYMLQFLAKLEKDPSQWLNSNAQDNGSKVVTDIKNTSYKKDNSYLNTTQQTARIEGVKLIASNEHELYRMFFRTSKYGSIKNKWDHYDRINVAPGSGDFSNRMIINYKGDEPWGKYDLQACQYVIGLSNVKYLQPLLNPELNPGLISGAGGSNSTISLAYESLYKYVKKLQFGGNKPCTADALEKDWTSIMTQGPHRTQPNAMSYFPNSTELADNTFSDLESVLKAVGMKYNGNGPTQLSNQELTLAYGNGGNKGGGNPMATLGNTPPQMGGFNLQNNVVYNNTMFVVWDYIHMSHYAHQDLYSFFASRGNMGLCENTWRDEFLKYYHPLEYPILMKKRGNSFYYQVKYQAPTGTTGKNINFNQQYFEY